MDLRDIFNNFGEILSLLVFVGIWIFGLLYRAFSGKPEERRPGRAAPEAGRPPALPPQEMEMPEQAQPNRRPGGLVGDPRREVSDFLENLRRQAENAAQRDKEFERTGGPPDFQEEEDEWASSVPFEDEVPSQPAFVAPPSAPSPSAEPRRFAAPAAVRGTLDDAPPVPEVRGNSPTKSGHYSPPNPFQLPGWLTLQEINPTKGSGKILGVSVSDAILINEILAPPLALRRRPPGAGPAKKRA